MTWNVLFSVETVNRTVNGACGPNPVCILTPWPRFVKSPCCTEPGHVSNFADPNSLQTILKDLTKLRYHLRKTFHPTMVVDTGLPGADLRQRVLPAWRWRSRSSAGAGHWTRLTLPNTYTPRQHSTSWRRWPTRRTDRRRCSRRTESEPGAQATEASRTAAAAVAAAQAAHTLVLANTIEQLNEAENGLR